MDLTIVRWAAEHLHGPFLDTVMPYITALGDSGFIWAVICFVLLARKKTRRAGIFCGLSLLIAYVSGEVVLKNLIQRPRPFTLLPGVSLLIPPPGSSSFPSGHTGSSFACAAAIFLLNKKWGVPALALAALIAFSRLYLSVHYPTDLLAGALLGVGSALLARWLCRRLLPRTPGEG